MTENTNITNFNFRSKFEKVLSDENRQVITAAFEKFCKMVPYTARKVLWKLTYNEDASVALDELGLNSEIISSENVSIFRNELRSQYEKLNANFLAVDLPEKCKEAFTALKKRTDSIVAYIVYAYCQERLHIKDGMDRVLFLLKSEDENNFFGGIRSLRFNKEESAYLKQFHNEIHDLLKALYDFKLQEDASFKNKPLSGLDEVLAETDLPFDFCDVPDEVLDELDTAEENANISQPNLENEEQSESKQEVVEENANISQPKLENEEQSESLTESAEKTRDEESNQITGLKPVNADEIMKHREVFKKFFNTGEKYDYNLLFQIGLFGYDLNEVMYDKKDKIIDLLLAVEGFEK